jgi:hypothetical protein
MVDPTMGAKRPDRAQPPAIDPAVARLIGRSVASSRVPKTVTDRTALKAVATILHAATVNGTATNSGTRSGRSRAR